MPEEQSEGATAALEKCSQSRVGLRPCDASLDRLIDVILHDRGTDDCMHLCG